MENETEVKEDVVEVAEGVTLTTAHKHYYEEGVTMNGLKDVICKCGAGLQIDPSIEIVKGVIQWTK